MNLSKWMINKSKTQAHKDSWGHGDTGGPTLSKKLLLSGKELQLSLPLPPSALHLQTWVCSRKPRRFSTDRILGKERRKGKDCSPPTYGVQGIVLPASPCPSLSPSPIWFPNFAPSQTSSCLICGGARTVYSSHHSLWTPGSTPCLTQPSHEH